MSEELDRSKQLGGVEPVVTEDPLVVLLYLLMRDHLNAGIFEKLVMEMVDKPVSLCNPYLAQYAENLARRLSRESADASRDLCGYCGHPRGGHSIERGCTHSMRRGTDALSTCSCMAFVEPTL